MKLRSKVVLRVLLFIFCLVPLLLNSCSREPKPPTVEHVEVSFDLIPFYQDLFSIEPDSFNNHVDELLQKYGSYLEAYSQGIIGAGSPHESDYASKMARFLSYEPNLDVLDTISQVYPNYDNLKIGLTKAFQYYKYYFPNEVIPDIYLHISGFNQSVAVDSSWISISIEKYLGRNCVFYEWLSVPIYLRRKSDVEKVVPDVVKALAMTRYAYNDSVNDLLNQMIYNGKILYFVKKMVPTLNDTLLFDYSKDELAWVKHYEKTMWSTVVERKHLFSTERLTVNRYIGDSPFTYFFGQDSPGRTGHYLGYRIIQSYMRRNPDITLEQLMKMNNGHEIFRSARYRP